MSKAILKTAKGMKDFGPNQTAIRELVFDKIKTVFKRHGAQAIETPVCELKETLLDKYGDDTKLIYELKDQGGELLALRYDLTVPFARFLAQNKIMNLKRYQIAKVYRRDNPSFNQGRYREFYQCDFDIAGKFDEMLPDSECLKILYEVLNDLNIKKFIIKVNHRDILNGIFKVCGIPENQFKTVCSSIDKLDKLSWNEIKKELINDKKIDEKCIDKIKYFVEKKGNGIFLDDLLETELSSIPESKKAIEDLKLFNKYCNIFDIDHSIVYDLSLARGLDYYNAIIFEAVLTQSGNDIGSIAAGGRYDNLVESLSDKAFNIPCVGVSLGVERIFNLIESQYISEKKKINVTQCYVCSIGPFMIEERLKLINELWSSGIRAEHSHKAVPKLLPQFKYCEERNIPFCVIIGRKEVDNNLVKLRDLNLRQEFEIERSKIIEELNLRLNRN